MNWEIVPQEQTVRGETFEVDCKNVAWRPSSSKEKQAGSGDFKRLGTTTLRIMFKHVKGDGTFKLVAQFRKGEWRVNLHEPDKIVPKDIKVNRMAVVSMPHPTETKVVKRSTGTKTYDRFFNVTFPERIRDSIFRDAVKSILDSHIGNIEDKQAA